MDEDMKEMVRQTLHPGDRADCYEPKLTRAKVRYVLIRTSSECFNCLCFIFYNNFKSLGILCFYAIAIYFIFIIFRKLLEEKPDLKIPILWPIPQNSTNFVSECLSLINENYTENSSEDEEYKPDADEVCFLM